MASVAEIDGLTVSGAPPAFTGLLDETYGSGAAAAYSVRRLYSLYTGDCMRVRRDSDDAEQDIGFDSNGDLDILELSTFVGSGNNGYVRYWYDQSQSGGTGTGNDYGASSQSLQPRIYNGTSVEDDNSEPAIYFVDGTSNTMGTAFNVTSQPLSVFQVMRKDSTASRASGVQTTTAAPYRDGWVITCDASVIRAWYDNDGAGGYSFVTVNHDGTTQSLQSLITSGTNIDFRIEGGTSATNTDFYTSTDPLYLHGWYSNQGARIQEIVLYTSDVGSSNRGSIENNIELHFNIT